jgi:ABC-type multidrug transport system fused ATPase/permease subunit
MSFIVPYNEESAYNSNSPDHDLLVEEQHYKAYDDDRDADPFTDDDLDSFQNVQQSSPSRYSDTGKLIPGTDTIIVNDLDYSVTLPSSNTVPTVHSTIKNFLLFRHMRQGDSKKIIQNCNLLIKPGTMTLIIGPPSSGKVISQYPNTISFTQ